MVDIFGAQEAPDPSKYQDTLFNVQKRQLAPQYAQAVRKARQGQANRGLLNSGIGGEQEQQLGQEFRSNLFGASQGAALDTEQQRREDLIRQFMAQQQKDLLGQQQAGQVDLFNRKAKEDRAAADQAFWGQLLGTAGKAVGGL